MALPRELSRQEFEGRYEGQDSLKRGRGRPSSFNWEMANEILLRLQEGETLLTICNAANYPERHTILAWTLQNEEFATKYARARANQAHSFVEEAVEICRQAQTKEQVMKARVQSDLLMRVAGKLNREAYGDILKIEKKDVTHAELIELAQKRLEAQKQEAKTIDLVPETVASEG